MSPHRPLAEPSGRDPVELRNPRWVCGCGRQVPIEDVRAYPVCECRPMTPMAWLPEPDARRARLLVLRGGLRAGRRPPEV